MNNTPPQVLPPQTTPPVNPIAPGSIEDVLGVANDKVTLGRMIQAIIKLDSEIPSEGGSIIKMIRKADTDYNLGLDFITTKEQDKLKAFDINGVDPLAPPIELAQMTSLASEFDQLQAALNGSGAGQVGLIDEFFVMNQTVSDNARNISDIQNGPIMNGEPFTPDEQSAISALNGGLLGIDSNGDYDVVLKTGTGLESSILALIAGIGHGAGGTQLTPDQVKTLLLQNQDAAFFNTIAQGKLNHITVSKNVDLDNDVVLKTDPAFVDLALISDIKTKTDLIAVTAPIDLDQVTLDLGDIPLVKKVTDNLEIAPAMPMLPDTSTTLENIQTSKDIMLDKPQVLPTDDIDKAGDNRLITVASTAAEIKAFGLGIDNAFEQIEEALAFAFKAGETSLRPTDADGMGPVSVGQQYFDTTLGKPIWCKTATVRTGTPPAQGDPGVQVWVDAMGKTV